MGVNKEVEVRKLYAADNGNGVLSYKTSLPSEWVKENGMEKGGYLVVKTNGNQLILEKMNI